ncbi:rab proteins geranylgeranyltransferase component A [Culicoides brevitarsis]|uniref:rab proteins geranylgeranyltransferase component A n=1 Tax=Culicoides brevitarsis TaxID=469753 RepID=UPI00307C776F
MTEDLPSEYDLIVLGTGLTESIVAAAAARIGKSVLHMDTNEYYGGNWAAFQLESFRKFIASHHESSENRTIAVTKEANFDQTTVEILPAGIGIENIEERWFDFTTHGSVCGWDQEKICKENRKFSIDLTPKLLFAKGEMVALLISSNICRYVQFRAVDRVATIKDATIKPVPSSRADVFTNKDVTVVEKRLLMKFIEVCLKYVETQDMTEFKDYEDKTFIEYLKHKKLTPNLIHYILYAIGMGNNETKCMEGVKNVAKFLTSIGHYGNTPFLFPMYGAGEIPQCFCRLCAVFAGIYCLSSPIKALEFKQNEDKTFVFDGLQYENRKLTSRNIVIGQGVVTKDVLKEEKPEVKALKCGKISRGVFITATPIGGLLQNQGKNGVMFLKLPPVSEKNHSGAFVIQLDHHSGVCPKGLYLIHVMCETITTPKDDLAPYVDQILKNTKSDIKTPSSDDVDVNFTDDEQPLDDETIPTILWSCYFNIPRCVACENESKSASTNVKLACGPFFELDFDRSINQAKEIFAELYPAEDFLPRAPEPDEIICEGEDPTVPKIELDPFLMETQTETLEGEAIEQAREARQAAEEGAPPENAKEAEEDVEKS